MAKTVLRVFGGLAMLLGVLLLGYEISPGVYQPDRYVGVVLPVGLGLVLFGAITVGFARVIALLERIEQNTATPR
ncbi:hypothetical protein [Methylobacterium sp. A54F]